MRTLSANTPMPDFPPAPLLDRLAAAATEWFPDLDPPVVARVVAASLRPQSALATVALEDAVDRSRAVIVKAPFWSGATTPPARGVDRPRLGLDPRDLRTKHRGEWHALVAAWDAFGAGDHRGLGAVRPCFHDDELGVLVLERIDDPTMRRLLDERDGGVALRDASEHTGAWLREFASLPRLADLPARRSTIDEVAAAVSTYRDWFGRATNRGATALADDVLRAFGQVHTAVEIGCGHGDLAPRNVFVRPDASVLVIDMLGQWRVPIYEDVAYFVLELVLGGRHLGRAGRDRSDLRARFLAGAGVEDDDLLAAFEGMVLLDKWAAAATAGADSPVAWARRVNRLRRISFAAQAVRRRLPSR